MGGSSVPGASLASFLPNNIDCSRFRNTNQCIPTSQLGSVRACGCWNVIPRSQADSPGTSGNVRKSKKSAAAVPVRRSKRRRTSRTTAVAVPVRILPTTRRRKGRKKKPTPDAVQYAHVLPRCVHENHVPPSRITCESCGTDRPMKHRQRGCQEPGCTGNLPPRDSPLSLRTIWFRYYDATYDMVLYLISMDKGETANIQTARWTYYGDTDGPLRLQDIIDFEVSLIHTAFGIHVWYLYHCVITIHA